MTAHTASIRPNPPAAAGHRGGRLLARAAAVLLLASLGEVTSAHAASAAVAISPSNTTYVGTVQGTNAFIAFVTDGKGVRSYVCDNATISTWLSGAWSKGVFRETAEGLDVTASRTARRVTGTVTTPDGVRHRFVAARVSSAGPAGLYRGELATESAKYVGGWIVLPDAQVRGYVEQDNVAVAGQGSTTGIIAILIGRRGVDLPGVGVLPIVDGTSNIRR